VGRFPGGSNAIRCDAYRVGAAVTTGHDFPIDDPRLASPINLVGKLLTAVARGYDSKDKWAHAVLVEAQKHDFANGCDVADVLRAALEPAKAWEVEAEQELWMEAIAERDRKERKSRENLESLRATAAAKATILENHPRGYTFAQACDAPLTSSYTVKGIAEPGAVSVFFGDSGTMKSFITTDLAAHVGSSRDWCGRRVRGTGVLVILGEGQAGYAKRLRVWAAERGIAPALVNLYVMPSPVDLSTDSEDVAVAISEAENALGRAVGFVLIDTYSTNLGDADEQSNSDAARVLGHARAAAGPYRALVFVHHVGHSEKDRERGAYQIRANADFRFKIERSGATITMTNAKAKEGCELPPMYFRFREIELGTDDEGDRITSLVMEPTDQPTQKPREVAKPAGANQRIVWDVVGELLRQSTTYGMAGAPAIRPCVTVGAAIEGCRGRLVVDEKHRKERTMTTINGLVGRKCLVLQDDWLWCP